VNSFTLHIWDDEGSKCCFYSVTKEGASTCETDKFLLKYETDPDYEEALNDLVTFMMEAIANDHGACDELLNRFENDVIGLPPKGKTRMIKEIYHYPNFPLRLYVLRITENILILFNGGVKDGAKNQTSSIHLNWTEACQFARKINQALQDGLIIVDGDRLIDPDGEEEIFIT
jgi:hypothetical protein